MCNIFRFTTRFIYRKRLKRWALSFLITVLYVFLLPVASAKISVYSIQTKYTKEFAKVILHLSGKPLYYWFLLNKPDRLVIDFKNMRYKENKPPSFTHLPIQNIRWDQKNNNTVRMVFDLSEKQKPRIYLLRDKNREYLLEVVFNNTRLANLSPKKPLTYNKQQTSTLPAAIIAPSSRRKIKVMIDPGHGGKDPGAMGYRQIQEKDVVLSIAKNLAVLLNKEPNFSAKLTRTNDSFLSLRERLNVARQYKADLFISIHANALSSRKAKGVMIFALSNKGAKSEMGRWLESKENGSILLNGDQHIDLTQKSNHLTKVLLDLSMASTLAHSVEVGKSIIETLKKSAIKIHTSKIEQAAFVVLKSPDIPSILVETGFLTTPSDARLLASKIYQHRFAMVLKRGIVQYFKDFPPVNHWLTQTKQHPLSALTTYKIKTGETLTIIANRFNMSVSQLLSMNKLTNPNHIKAGQVIIVSSLQQHTARQKKTLTKP